MKVHSGHDSTAKVPAPTTDATVGEGTRSTIRVNSKGPGTMSLQRSSESQLDSAHEEVNSYWPILLAIVLANSNAE